MGRQKQKTYTKKIGAILSGVALSLSLVQPVLVANAQIPQTINYQSRLRTIGGIPITATTTIQFSLYSHISNGSSGDAPGSAGPLLWKETYDQSSGACSSVQPDAQGYFFVQLGSCVTFPSYIQFDSPLYLGVKISSDAEAAPRVLLAAFPYALNSQRVNSLEATTTATGGQLLALENDLSFNIATGTFYGGGLSINGTSTLQNLTFTVATGTSLNLSNYLAIGAIRLDSTGTNNITSGAYLVGVFDEFDNSNATTVQAVLSDLDAAITAVSSTMFAMDLQRVTDNGATTTNWIEFAGATSVGDIIPGTNNTYSIGNTNLRWSDIWGANLHIGTSTWDLAQSPSGALTFSRNSASSSLTIASNGNVGIGTENPMELLDVVGTKSAFSRYSNDGLGFNYIVQKARGTLAVPLATQPNDILGQYTFKAYDGATYQNMARLFVRRTDGTLQTEYAGEMQIQVKDIADLNPVAKFYFKSDGKMGIGVEEPTNLLHVNGAITIASSTPATSTYALYNLGGDLYWNGAPIATGTNFGALNFQQATDNGATTTNSIQFAGATSVGDIIPGANNTYTLGNTDYRWSDVWGANLHVGTSTWDLAQAADGAFTISQNAGSERMRVATNGYVGIGTNSPEQMLSIRDNLLIGQYSGISPPSGRNAVLYLRAIDGFNPGIQGTAYTNYQRGSSDIARIGIDTLNSINFDQWTGSAWANRMMINSAGNVAIGSTSANSIFHVMSGAASTTAIFTQENNVGDYQTFNVEDNPEGQITGSVGDIAMDVAHGIMYVKVTGNSNATGWERVFSSATGLVTLDTAYDGGGSGAGRTIITDAGPIIITNTTGTLGFLSVTHSTDAEGLWVNNLGNGSAFSARNMGSGSGFYSRNQGTGYGARLDNGTDSGIGLFIDNPNNGSGLRIDNAGNNFGQVIYNNADGMGLNIQNTSSGLGFYIRQNDGRGMVLDNNTANRGLEINNNGTGQGIYVYNQSPERGFQMYDIGGKTGFQIDKPLNGGNAIEINTDDSARAFYISHDGDGEAFWMRNQGTGPSLWIEDAASDSSPFVLNASGYLGIGTPTPSTLLHVQGGLNGRAVLVLDSDDGNNDGQDAGIYINSDYNAGSDAAFIEFANNGTATGKIYSAPSESAFMSYGNNPLHLYTNSNARLTVSGSGNIGISTSSPAYRLDINGDSRLNGQLMLGRYASLPGSGYQSGSLVYNTSSSTVNYWDGTQWRTVATASDVRSSLWDTDHDTGVQVEESADEDYVRFDTAGVQRMFIQNDGKIGINTTGPLQAGLQIGQGGHMNAALSINGNPGDTGIVAFRDEDGEDIFTAMGSLANNDFVFMMGDIGNAYGNSYGGTTGISINQAEEAYIFGRAPIRLNDNGGGEYVGFISPASITSSTIWTLPGADGMNNQVLVTNGSGTLSWATSSNLVNNIYTADGDLTGDRSVNGNGHGLTYSNLPYISNFATYFYVDTSAGTWLEMDNDQMSLAAAAGRIVLNGTQGIWQDDRAVGDQRGIEYFADYSADYSDRSLVDKEYVDNAITSSTLSFDNGLVNNVGTVELGGSLTKNTTIDLATFDLQFDATDGYFKTTDDRTEFAYGDSYFTAENVGFEIEAADSNEIANLYMRNNLFEISGYTSTSAINPNFHGATYGDDYSTYFVDRSLVDKEYVDNAITSSTVAAGNGLTLSSGVMKLGGDLSETTYIDHQGFDLIIREFAGEPETIFSGDNFKIQDGGYEVRFGIGGPSDVGISLTNPSSTYDLFAFNTSIGIITNRNDFQGLTYDKNYSSYFVDRSLVDKAYVDNHISAVTLQGATDNSIAADGYVMFDTGAAYWEDDGGSMKLEAKAGGYEVAIGEAGGSRLYFKSFGDVFNPTAIKFFDGRGVGDRSGIEYFTDYSADYTLRSLVDKGYVDGLVSSSTALNLQQVTDNGATTTNRIQFAGATSTAPFAIYDTNNPDYKSALSVYSNQTWKLFTASNSDDTEGLGMGVDAWGGDLSLFYNGGNHLMVSTYFGNSGDNYDYVFLGDRRLTVRQSSGFVGINTETPNNFLDVNGAISIASSTPATSTYALYNLGGDLYWNGSPLIGMGGDLNDAYNYGGSGAGRTIYTTGNSTPVEIINPGTDQWETSLALTNGANGGGLAMQTMDAGGDYGSRLYFTDNTSDPVNGTGAYMYSDNTMQAFEFGYQTAGTRNSSFYIDYNQMSLNVPGTPSNGAFGIAAINYNVPILTLRAPGAGTNSIAISVGTSTPEVRVVGNSGSLFTRTDGVGGSQQLYVKTTDGGNTGWVALGGSGSAPSWQQVTDVGATTTNWVQFAGATSTDDFIIDRPTSPASLNVISGTDDAYLRLIGNAGATDLMMSSNNGVNWSVIETANDGSLNFNADGNNVMWGDGSTGYLGVGTNNPGYKIDVVGDSRVSAQFMLGQYALNPASGNQAGAMIYNTASSTPFYWNGGQWVALGGSSAIAGALWDTDHDTGIQVEESADEDIIRFDTAGTEYFTIQGPRLRVLNSGNSVFLGQDAGRVDDLTTNNNVFVGRSAGYSNTSGFSNVYIGYEAGYAATTQESTVAIGREAGRNNTGAFGNTMLGYYAGADNTGNDNVMIGYESGVGNTGGDNFFMGRGTGWNNTGSQNIMMGYFTGYDNKGSSNILFGSNAGSSNKGTNGIFMGANAGHNNIGNDNIFLGYNTGLSNATGTRNLFLGREAGYSNVLGNGNIFLGYQAGYSETNSDRLYIDNSNTANPLVYGRFDTNVLRINGSLQVNNPSSTGYALPEADGSSYGLVLASNADGNLYWSTTTQSSHLKKVTNVLSPVDSAVYQFSVTNNNANTLTGFKAVNTNDVSNYAGAVLELKGSGADYTNNLYFGKYGSSFYVPSWAGNGVLATDKNLVIGSLGTGTLIRFQVGGGYTTPATVATLDSDSLDLSAGISLNVGGNTVLGDATSDTVTYNARVASNILPSVNNTYSLGNTTNRWSDIWGANVHIGTSTWDLAQSANGAFTIGQNGGSERMRITSSGLVGIGNVNPSRTLDIQGSATPGDNLFRVGGGADGGYLSVYTPSDDDRNTTIEWQKNLNFHMNGNDVMVIENDGDVGIGTGTTMPNSRLQISADNSASDASLLRFQASNDSDIQSEIYFTNGGNATYWNINSSGAGGALIMMNESSEVAKFTNSGLIVNDGSLSGIDFRVESDTNTHAMFVDATNGYVGFDQSVPLAKLHVGNTTAGSAEDYEYMRLQGSGDVDHRVYLPTGSNLMVWDFNNTDNGGAIEFRDYGTRIGMFTNSGLVINDGGVSGVGLRVEGDTNANLLYTDAANDRVGVGTNVPQVRFHVTQSGDVVAAFDRTTSDGTIISLRQDGVEEGTISVSANTVSYNAFTGSHYAWTNQAIEKGMLVTLTGENRYLHNNTDSEILYGVIKSTEINDTKVMGSYLSLQEPTEVSDENNPHLIMAVGNGEVWIADKGENINIGDYFISSDIAGHAEKDTGEFMVSHIVARAAESVDWTHVATQIDGVKHKKISVFFESFDKNNMQASVAGTSLQGGADNIDAVNLVVADAVFEGNITVKGHVAYAKDVVGQALIMTGDTRVSVKFENEYGTLPIVTVTPSSKVTVPYWVENASIQGFDIVLDEVQYSDLLFNWHSFGNDEGRVYVSNGTTLDIITNDMGSSDLETQLNALGQDPENPDMATSTEDGTTDTIDTNTIIETATGTDSGVEEPLVEDPQPEVVEPLVDQTPAEPATTSTSEL